MLERLVALKVRCVRASSELFISRTLYIELSTKNNNKFILYSTVDRQLKKKPMNVYFVYGHLQTFCLVCLHSVSILCTSCFPFLALLLQRKY